MFSKYCNTYSVKEMIHWNHTSQVKQKPVSEAIFLFSSLPPLHSPFNPFTIMTV
jgi:hypothetical protein